MKIYRTGANRYTGHTTLVEDEGGNRPNVHQSLWINEQGNKEVQLTAFHNTHNELKGEYDYFVHLSLHEISRILTSLADEGLEKMPDDIATALKPARASLLRLLLCTEGYESKPRTEPK